MTNYKELKVRPLQGLEKGEKLLENTKKPATSFSSFDPKYVTNNHFPLCNFVVLIERVKIAGYILIKCYCLQFYVCQNMKVNKDFERYFFL